MQINITKLNTVVETAKAKTTDRRWRNAIDKAAAQLRDNPYISEVDGGLLILSTSGKTYHANGVCQCAAFAKGTACWHRSAARLMVRYKEVA
jgi:hypothetical protein